MFSLPEWSQMPYESISSTFGLMMDRPFRGQISSETGLTVPVAGTLSFIEGEVTVDVILLEPHDTLQEVWRQQPKWTKLQFSARSYELPQANIIWHTHTVPMDLPQPWQEQHTTTLCLDTEDWPGYGSMRETYTHAYVRIGGLPRFIQNQWDLITIRSYQNKENKANHQGLILEADDWQLELRESPDTTNKGTYYYVGEVKNNSRQFTLEELKEFLNITELFLSFICNQQKRFDIVTALQQAHPRTSQRSRILKANNLYLRLKDLDPQWWQLAPWLELYEPFYRAHQNPVSGRMFAEAIKRYVSAKEIARYSPYPLSQTWSALEAITKVFRGNNQEDINSFKINDLVANQAYQMANLPEPYTWTDSNNEWTGQANKVRNDISHGNIVDHHEPEIWFTTQKLVRALIMTYLNPNP